MRETKETMEMKPLMCCQMSGCDGTEDGQTLANVGSQSQGERSEPGRLLVSGSG